MLMYYFFLRGNTHVVFNLCVCLMYTHCIIFFTYFCGAGVLLYGPPGTGELFLGRVHYLMCVIL